MQIPLILTFTLKLTINTCINQKIIALQVVFRCANSHNCLGKGTEFGFEINLVDIVQALYSDETLKSHGLLLSWIHRQTFGRMDRH